MADITPTAADIRALEGAVLRPYDAGAELDVGEWGYVAADGDIEGSDANVAVSSDVIGIIVAVADTSGGITAAAGDALSVCTFGPVSGFSGLTPGDRVYVSETANKVADVAPSGALTWTHCVGYVESATTIFVMPGVSAPSSNS